MSKMKTTLLLMTGLVLILSCNAFPQSSEKSLRDDTVKRIAGSCGDRGFRTWSINSMPIDGESINCSGDCWVTYDVRYWNGFTAVAGIPDDDEGANGSVTIETDGAVVKTVTQKHRQAATPIAISLAGKHTMTIRWKGNTVYLINPKLTKSVVAEPDVTDGGNDGVKTTVAISSSPFAIDSNGLDRLAASLLSQCQAKPALKSKIETGQVAIARFSLIGMSAKAVADNVVENLYTAMIKGGFSLVERGQLDKVLNELKVQDSGAVDPATAQKIGKLSGCDIILLGSVSDQGLIVINARMMDTATGKSIAAERVKLQKIPIK